MADISKEGGRASSRVAPRLRRLKPLATQKNSTAGDKKKGYSGLETTLKPKNLLQVKKCSAVWGDYFLIKSLTRKITCPE